MPTKSLVSAVSMTAVNASNVSRAWVKLENGFVTECDIEQAPRIGTLVNLDLRWGSDYVAPVVQLKSNDADVA